MEIQEFKKYIFEETLAKNDVVRFFGIPEQFKEFRILPYTRVQNGEVYKRPSYSWGKYRDEEFNFCNFFKNHTDIENTNFCVLTGINGLCEIDLDDDILYEKFKFDQIDTLVIRSGSGGYKIYFTVEELPPRKTGYNQFPLDLITEGNLSVIPPSVNANGPYTVFKDRPILHVANIEEFLSKVPIRTEKHIDIRDFKKKLDIVSVVEDLGLSLDQKGKIYRGLCPFHDEVTPSFTVYKSTQSFYCFGCQTSGDVITFVEKFQGVGFKEAVEYLSSAYGIEKPALNAKEKKDKDVQRSINQVLDEAEAELWHYEGKDSYITLVDNGVQENYLLGTERTLNYIQSLLLKKINKMIPQKVLENHIGYLSALARQYKNYEPFVRCGYDDHNFYLDLTDEKRRVIKINKDGWSIVDRCPIKFVRTEGQKALPLPIREGAIKPFYDLLGFSEVEGEEHKYRNEINARNRAFCGAALVESLIPRGPKTIKTFDGQHGSAKTWDEFLMISMIDPRTGIMGALPKSPDDYYVKCLNSWLVGLDNLRGVSNEWSDILCRVATGIGIVKRRLYTDGETFSADFTRGQWLNGIGQLGFRDDLIDRALRFFLLPPIVKRSPEDILKDFEEIRPGVLGALLDMVVGGLNNIDEIKKETPPEEVRMIDFYHWGKAALPKELNFEHHYLSMIKLTWVKQVETDELSYKIFQKSAGLKTPYTATPKKFLKDIVGDYGVLGITHPKMITTYLQQRIPSLAANGVKLEITERNERKNITLHPLDEEKGKLLLGRELEENIEHGDLW